MNINKLLTITALLTELIMRKLILILVLFFTGLSSNPQRVSASDRPADASGKSAWVYPGKDGKLVYQTTPAGDKIMDFSHAGYMGGGVALPVVPVKKTVKPSGAKDETETIQSAINEVASHPLVAGFRGAILLEPGVYNCSATITIAIDGIVLRGSGSGKEGSTINMNGNKHSAIVIGKD